MSSQSEKLQQNAQHFNQMMREIEEIDPDSLLALVPGSSLHQFVNSPDNDASEQA